MIYNLFILSFHRSRLLHYYPPFSRRREQLKIKQPFAHEGGHLTQLIALISIMTIITAATSRIMIMTNLIIINVVDRA